MPTRGPIPKRAALRRRRNKPAVPLLTARSAGAGQWPEADPEWHPLAKMYYSALQASPQSSFYEASDRAYARVNAQVLHQLLNGSGARPSGHGMSSMLLAAWDVGASKLMVTQADRLRLRIELQKEPVDPPFVGIMRKYRTALGVVH